jgi:hypothetical protein
VSLRNASVEEITVGQAILKPAGWVPPWENVAAVAQQKKPVTANAVLQHQAEVLRALGGHINRFYGSDDVWVSYRAVEESSRSIEDPPLLVRQGGSSAAVQLDKPKQSFLDKCLALLTARRGLLTAGQYLALERQLRSILIDEAELQEQKIFPSFASLDVLINFLSENRATLHPRVSITRKGLFAASWAPNATAKLTLTFGPHEISWVAADLNASPPFRGSSGLLLRADVSALPRQFVPWMYA